MHRDWKTRQTEEIHERNRARREAEMREAQRLADERNRKRGF